MSNAKPIQAISFATRWRWPLLLGAAFVAIGILVGWDRDWLRPLVAREASAALGRKVSLRHFAFTLGKNIVVVADGVQISNPDGFAQDPPFAKIEQLTVTIDTMELLRHRTLVIPDILIDRPELAATQEDDGSANYLFPALSSDPSRPATKLGNLRILNGQAHAVLKRLHADFNVAVATHETDSTPQIVAHTTGTYAGQPITADFIGGGLLALSDAATPYAVDLKLQNGPTHASLVGAVQNPLNFSGVNLKLQLTGTNMELLLPLIGIAFPKTPSYKLQGDLDYTDGKIHFRDFAGKLGSSDVQGNLEILPGRNRPVVNANVTSRQVDLADLGGFIGSEPGRLSTPNQTPEQRQAVARAEANPRFLPTTMISLPKLLAADVHLKYRGTRILGRNMPFDSLSVEMDIVDGRILLHPISLGVGQGKISGTIALTPVSNELFHTQANVDLQRVDLGRILQATNLVTGAGVFGGRAELETTGNSMSTMLGNGNGLLKLTMAGGGNLSALLVDLSGLQFGNALLSALGVPARDDILCFVGDFVLQRGVLQTRALLLDTTSDITSGSGQINLRAETLDYEIRTEPKHFTIGALPAPISITGSFKGPGVLPDIGKLAVRSAAAIGLGILFPPAALLPTIQFGVGDDHRCEALRHRIR